MGPSEVAQHLAVIMQAASQMLPVIGGTGKVRHKRFLDFQGLSRCFLRFRRIIKSSKGHGQGLKTACQILPVILVLRLVVYEFLLQLDGGGTGFGRLVRPALSAVGRGEHGVSECEALLMASIIWELLRQARSQLEGLLEVLIRLGQPAGLTEENSEIVIRVREIFAP